MYNLLIFWGPVEIDFPKTQMVYINQHNSMVTLRYDLPRCHDSKGLFGTFIEHKPLHLLNLYLQKVNCIKPPCSSNYISCIFCLPLYGCNIRMFPCTHVPLYPCSPVPHITS